jgi:putative transposase
MDGKFQSKYRISSIRLQTWDYSNEGSYFITICTANRTHFFGKIENGKMKLSHVGVIADLMWFEIKNHAKNIELGEFIVMPNHIHGILILNNNQHIVDALSPSISNETIAPIGQKRFQNQGKNSISAIIGAYKSAVTKHSKAID